MALERKVEIAIIGAGSAGLTAMSVVRRHSDDFVLINDGPRHDRQRPGVWEVSRAAINPVIVVGFFRAWKSVRIAAIRNSSSNQACLTR